MGNDNYDRGTVEIVLIWIFTVLALTAVTIRIYSRAFLTRSIGSDDFTIIIPTILTIFLTVTNTIAYCHGYGRHIEYISSEDLYKIEKWGVIDWIVVFIVYFFIRSSVMLFVLRLLPPQKKWQARVVYVAFFLNLAITIIATVIYGIKCIPFTANWKDVPGSRCLPESYTTASQYVNGILACVIDITTALIPEFLLWKVQMKPKTKFFLYIFFGGGLITAGLSIGRVATTNNGTWQTDPTWRLIPSDTFSTVEDKCGIIFASAPAVRQFFAYRKRVGTIRPSSEPPMADFAKFRRRVNLRDLFWYREAVPTNGRVLDGRRIFRTRDVSSESSSTPVPAEKSRLDVVEAEVQHKVRWLSLPFRRPRSSKSSTSTLRRDLLPSSET